MIGETFKNLLFSLAGLIVGLSAIYLIIKYSFKLTVERAIPNLIAYASLYLPGVITFGLVGYFSNSWIFGIVMGVIVEAIRFYGLGRILDKISSSLRAMKVKIAIARANKKANTKNKPLEVIEVAQVNLEKESIVQEQPVIELKKEQKEIIKTEVPEIIDDADDVEDLEEIEGLERVAVLEHIEMVAETKEEILVENDTAVKRERKQAESTPDTQEIYEQLQLVLVGGDLEKNNEEISLD
ncbi:hypothetical protein P4U05_27990 [Bacillus paranthracis]|uniref:hypothetical protein n=1 Tax=Bacillus cereus group TaxID=86661 RepID=UPI0001A07E92|nr:MULTISPECIES: hypothetical protein [Bacillus cereus group]ADY24784.1 hypothetical protein YBT020_28139 [Bacillus thuringiensis serovar finitimus YBT-020]MRC74404.1 hypothetical protein [Bacillus thuringiensis]OTX67240.1 hypothetical protein BK722_20755 [Bacillus thuringiensis serovar finitimus]EEL25548.1 hypothetical protein bcere0018_53830 [Bacillus cereus Rock1-15]MCR6801101.1 hypothetical protein [Bacillus paranthracis]